jgi:hypothetical protein
MQPGNSYTRGICTYSYPHSRERHQGADHLRSAYSQDPAGDRLEVENHLKSGSGPPINIHNQHPSHARRCGFFVPYEADVENRLLGGTGVQPTQTSSPAAGGAILRDQRQLGSHPPDLWDSAGSSSRRRRGVEGVHGRRPLHEALNGHQGLKLQNAVSCGSAPCWLGKFPTCTWCWASG